MHGQPWSSGRNALSSSQKGLGLQAVNSLDGAVVDAVTLTKPPGWRPDQSARLHTLALFHANYTPTWLELSGINGPAEELIFQPAEALLFSEPELLDSLRNATLIQVRPCLLAEVYVPCRGTRRASWSENSAASSQLKKLLLGLQRSCTAQGCLAP